VCSGTALTNAGGDGDEAGIFVPNEFPHQEKKRRGKRKKTRSGRVELGENGKDRFALELVN